MADSPIKKRFTDHPGISNWTESQKLAKAAGFTDPKDIEAFDDGRYMASRGTPIPPGRPPAFAAGYKSWDQKPPPEEQQAGE